jgi:hypothetical protein
LPPAVFSHSQNRDILQSEQEPIKISSSPEKTVRAQSTGEHKARLESVKQALADAGVDADKFVTAESMEDGGDEELCLRLESVEAQRKLGTSSMRFFIIINYL